MHALRSSCKSILQAFWQGVHSHMTCSFCEHARLLQILLKNIVSKMPCRIIYNNHLTRACIYVKPIRFGRYACVKVMGYNLGCVPPSKSDNSQCSLVPDYGYNTWSTDIERNLVRTHSQKKYLQYVGSYVSRVRSIYCGNKVAVLTTEWLHCKNKLVVLTTEWLPLLQTNWSDSGGERFAFVMKTNCIRQP